MAAPGPQKPTKAARDAWIAAAATRVLAASIHRHSGWEAYGLAWRAKKKALRLAAKRAMPAGERAAAAAASAAAEAAKSIGRRAWTGDEAAEAASQEAAREYGRTCAWLKRSARAFGRSARCDRAEAAEEERAAGAYRRADMPGREQAARRRAAMARRSQRASAASAKRAGEEVDMFRTVIDTLAAGRLGEAGREGLSQWLSGQAARADAVKRALAVASKEIGRAAAAGQAAIEGVAHAKESVEREAAPAAAARKADAASGKEAAPEAQEAARAWNAAMAAASSALEAANGFDDARHGRGRPKRDGGARGGRRPASGP